MATVIVPKNVTDLSALTVATGDTLVFGEGSQTITNVTPGAATALNKVFVGKPASVVVGNAAAGPFATPINNGSSPVLVLNGVGGSWTQSGSTTRIKQLAQTSLNLVGGTHTLVETRSSSLYINGSAVVTKLISAGADVQALSIATTNGFQECRITGGSATLGRCLDSNFSGPRLTVTGGASVVVKADDTGTNTPVGTGSTASGVIEVMNGRIDWQGGDIDTLYILGDSMFSTANIPASITITNLFMDFKAAKRSILKGNANSNATVTVTNTTIWADDADTLVY